MVRFFEVLDESQQGAPMIEPVAAPNLVSRPENGVIVLVNMAVFLPLSKE